MWLMKMLCKHYKEMYGIVSIITEYKSALSTRF